MPVAILTGASKGLGRALAGSLAERGWPSSSTPATPTPSRAPPLTCPAWCAVAGDVADPAHRAALVAAAQRLGRLDLLVNNASTLGASPLPASTLPLDAYRPHARGERGGAARPRAGGAAAPARPPRPRSSNITSDAGVEGYERGAATARRRRRSSSCRTCSPPRSPAVRVYWVDPGDMRTEMHQDAFPGEDISDRPPPDDSVPGLLALIDGDRPSGRYAARARGGAMTRR